MADNKNTTNSVDLSNVDLSTLTLVNREALLDDLSKRLKKTIRDTFEEETDKFGQQTRKNTTGPSAPANTPQAPQSSHPRPKSSAPKKKPQSATGAYDEDEDRRALGVRVRKSVDRILDISKKEFDKKKKEELKGSVTSTSGRRYADQLDDIVDELHELDYKELAKVKDKLESINHLVKIDTVGKEQAILNAHINTLTQKVTAEVDKRKGFFGNMKQFMEKQSIDATSIIAGLSSNSPMVMMGTKFILEKIKQNREDRQKKDRDQHKIGKVLRDKLQPPKEAEGPTPLTGDKPIHALEEMEPGMRKEVLDRLLANGHIDKQRHEELHQKLIPVGFDEVHGNKPEAEAPVQASVPKPRAPKAPKAARPDNEQVKGPNDHYFEGFGDEHGATPKPEASKVERVGRFEAPPKKQTAKEKQGEQIQAWYNVGIDRYHKRLEEQYADQQKKPPMSPDDPSYGFFNDPDIVGPDILKMPPSALGMVRKMLKRSGPVKSTETETPQSPSADNVVPFKRKAAVQRVARVPDEYQVAAARASVAEPIGDFYGDESKTGRASKRPTGRAITSRGSRQLISAVIVADRSKENRLLQATLRKMEKNGVLQVKELEKVNKNLSAQLDASDLARDAALRDTKDKALLKGVPSTEGKGKEGGGGIGGMLNGVVGHWLEGALGGSVLGRVGTSLFGKVKGFFKGGKAATQVEEGVGAVSKAGQGAEAVEGGMKGAEALSGVAKATKGAEAVEGGMKGAEALSGVAKGAEVAGEGMKGAGILAKVGEFGGLAGKVGKVGGIVGKAAPALKTAGKFAVPLTLALETINGFMNANKILQKRDRDVSGGERALTAGVQGVYGTTIGTVGAGLDLLGIKPKWWEHALGSGLTRDTVEAITGLTSLRKNSRDLEALKKSLDADDKAQQVREKKQDTLVSRMTPEQKALWKFRLKKSLAVVKDPERRKQIQAQIDQLKDVPDIDKDSGEEISERTVGKASPSATSTSPTPVPVGDSSATPQGTPASRVSQPPQEQSNTLSTPAAGVVSSLFGNTEPTTQPGPSRLSKSTEAFPKSVSTAGKALQESTKMTDSHKMAELIARREGFYLKDKNGKFKDTVARRNNNPGNLRPYSKDQKRDKNGYRIFDTLDEGWAALERQVRMTAAKGGGLNMYEFFGGKKGVYSGYAPAADKNDPKDYAESVAKQLGVDPKSTISFSPATMEKSIPPDGLRLAKASTENAMMKTTMTNKAPAAPVVVAPSTSVTNNNSSYMADLKAQNSESTYQRNMNQMYVPT